MNKGELLDQAPANGPFRIHIVAEMTGIPEPTLRAWERRYGIPSPERTASGYRLYSLREVEQVRAMRLACEGGMSAAEAARWVRSSQEGPASRGTRDPRAPKTSSGTDAARTEEVPHQDVLPAHVQDTFATAQRALLDAIEELDDVALESRLRQVMFLGSATHVLEHVLRPTLTEVGNLWYAGKLTVLHEHFASQRISTALRDLVRLNTASPPNGETIVLGAFADDEHEIGSLGLALHVASWGFRPIFLGARTPPSAIRNAIEQMTPAIVALSATLVPEPPRARELVEDYASACDHVPWIVGGSAAQALAELIRRRGGHVDPGDLHQLRALLRRLAPGTHHSKERKGSL